MPYQIAVSEAFEDTAWDDFLARTPGGHHVQTSLWARVKATLGWWTLRLVVKREAQIVAGVQLLIRSLARWGKIGYAVKGPLLAVDDPQLMELMIAELCQLARCYHIHCIAVQPPNNGAGLVPHLLAGGFEPTQLVLEPLATTKIDLSNSLDTLLAKMDGKTRYNLRLGLRKGMSVREGTEAELDTYYQMLLATSQRQGFSTFSPAYFTTMWQLLHPHGYLQLFFAEYQGEVVSAQLVVPFADTLINKLSVWSGNHSAQRPNEVLQWSAIQWGKLHNYQWYDMEGIELAAAQAHLRHEPLHPAMKQTVTSFKLGFGGEVKLLPGVYLYIYNPLLRLAYHQFFMRYAKSATMKALLQRLRTQENKN